MAEYDHKAAMRECQRRLREQRRSARACVGCGAPLGGDARKYCGACRARARAEDKADRRERSAEGICWRCPKPAAPGRRLCAHHLRDGNARQIIRRNRLRRGRA